MISIRSTRNLLLGDNRFQLRVVDVMAENEILLILYKKEYTRYQGLRKELSNLKERAAQSKQEEDYIRFQLDQLEEANLQPDEQDELEQEQETLSHAEEIKSSLYRVSSCLDGEEQGVVSLLKESLSSMDTLERYFPRAKEIAERLRSAYIDLNDLASEMEGLIEDVEFNPDRLTWVNERLDTLYALQQKHRVSSVEELIVLRDQFPCAISGY